ncbi:hypothetical protein [Grimontia marina]|uniref:Uncharacterized protein n=1 Tax=Grimontia marina TaxID=646534 RepID=A0A128FH08_9GAMM|nr:hypothetical protein [Grimontia marina]CZF86079.1 hypothetical protein GMA8713_04112 [Grimontia marina]
MKKTLKSLTAHKFTLFVAGAIVANTLIFVNAEKQGSKWIGTVSVGEYLKLTHTVQFKDTLDIRVTEYKKDFDPKKDKTFHVSYTYELQPPNRILLLNDLVPLRSTIHAHYLLDEKCALIFLSPKNKNPYQMSLACLY